MTPMRTKNTKIWLFVLLWYVSKLWILSGDLNNIFYLHLLNISKITVNMSKSNIN